jgi:hypothetical protein
MAATNVVTRVDADAIAWECKDRALDGQLMWDRPSYGVAQGAHDALGRCQVVEGLPEALPGGVVPQPPQLDGPL